MVSTSINPSVLPLLPTPSPTVAAVNVSPTAQSSVLPFSTPSPTIAVPVPRLSPPPGYCTTQCNKTLLHGSVGDINGKVLADVVITVISLVIGETYQQTTTTDNQGNYQFEQVPADLHLNLKVEKAGYDGNQRTIILSSNKQQLTEVNSFDVTVMATGSQNPNLCPTLCHVFGSLQGNVLDLSYIHWKPAFLILQQLEQMLLGPTCSRKPRQAQDSF